MTKKYLVVFEQGPTSYGALSPDIPGCFAVGSTLEETRSRFIEAAESHLEWLAQEHDPIPLPAATSFEFGPDEPGNETNAYTLERIALRVPTTEHALSA